MYFKHIYICMYFCIQVFLLFRLHYYYYYYCDYYYYYYYYYSTNRCIYHIYIYIYTPKVQPFHIFREKNTLRHWEESDVEGFHGAGQHESQNQSTTCSWYVGVSQPRRWKCLVDDVFFLGGDRWIENKQNKKLPVFCGSEGNNSLFNKKSTWNLPTWIVSWGQISQNWCLKKNCKGLLC